MNHFAELVGQEEVKRKLSFYLEAHAKTELVPFLNFVGAKGLGKTAFVREFAKNIYNTTGVNKPLLELNSSSIKSGNQFFEQVFLPHIQDQEIICFFDEAHCLPRDFSYALLSILSTEKDHVIEYNGGKNNYIFNFKKHHFIFATTESDKLFIPLRDRLTTIEFADYNASELREIFQKSLPNINFDEDALSMLSETSRGNARSCVLRAKEVKLYTDRYEITNFTKEDAQKLFFILGILPYGLNRIEWQILNILRKEGSCTLSMLAAKTGLSRTAIQRDHELYLIRKGFISIDSIRYITANGCKALETIKK
jgi:Holliday junction resolvasome RuvABC ATP-dependent DNA helicase subunit